MDYFSIRADKYEALGNLSASESVIVIDGYVAEKNVDKLVAKLEKKFTVAVSVTEPPEDAGYPGLA